MFSIEKTLMFSIEKTLVVDVQHRKDRKMCSLVMSARIATVHQTCTLCWSWFCKKNFFFLKKLTSEIAIGHWPGQIQSGTDAIRWWLKEPNGCFWESSEQEDGPRLVNPWSSRGLPVPVTCCYPKGAPHLYCTMYCVRHHSRRDHAVEPWARKIRIPLWQL